MWLFFYHTPTSSIIGHSFYYLNLSTPVLAAAPDISLLLFYWSIYNLLTYNLFLNTLYYYIHTYLYTLEFPVSIYKISMIVLYMYLCVFLYSTRLFLPITYFLYLFFSFLTCPRCSSRQVNPPISPQFSPMFIIISPPYYLTYFLLVSFPTVVSTYRYYLLIIFLYVLSFPFPHIFNMNTSLYHLKSIYKTSLLYSVLSIRRVHCYNTLLITTRGVGIFHTTISINIVFSF